ncbi:MAG: molybdopterin-dependent oxidoreductase, partial [Cyclobacteriaceae bacterium]
KNGGKIISVNPLEEAGLIRFKDPQTLHGTLGRGVSMTDVFLQVKINQDVALLKLILKKLAAIDKENSEVFDHEFIREQTEGYEALISDLATYDENQLLQQCGVSADAINQAVELLATRKRIIICWAMGLTQHKNGVENIKECVNLLLLKGSIGRKGSGTCPVRGHSNVQGDRTVGIMHYVSESLNRSIKEVFGFTPPDEEGVDTVKAMEAMYEGSAKVFVSLGGNFVSAASDTHYTAKALQNCELTVCVSTKLNRTHMITGETAIILPTLGRSEQDIRDGKKHYITVENSMGRVHRSAGILPPVAENLKSEPVIIGELAAAYFRLNPEKEAAKVDWIRLGSDYEVLRDKISKIIDGFEAYSKRSEGHGFLLPNNARERDFSSLPNGKAVLSICKTAAHQTADDEFILMTIRSHDQFNTTIYGLNDRYRGIYNGRRIVFISPNDLEKHRLKANQMIDLTSNYDNIRRVAEHFMLVPYNIPEGNLAAYFPETNVLVPYNHYADRSHTPISKSVVVKISPRS